MNTQLTLNDMQYINEELNKLNIDNTDTLEKFKTLVEFYKKQHEQPEIKNKASNNNMIVIINDYCFSVESLFNGMMSKYITNFHKYCDVEVVYYRVKYVDVDYNSKQLILTRYCLGINGVLPHTKKCYDHVMRRYYPKLMDDENDNDKFGNRHLYKKLIEYKVIEKFKINVLSLLILTKSHLEIEHSDLCNPHEFIDFLNINLSCNTSVYSTSLTEDDCDYLNLFGDFQFTIFDDAEDEEKLVQECVNKLTNYVKYIKSLTKDNYQKFLETEFIQAIPHIQAQYYQIGNIDWVNNIYTTVQSRPYRV